jgi:hypothetical protein
VVTLSYQVVKASRPANARLTAGLFPQHRDRRPELAESLDRIAASAQRQSTVRQPQLGQVHTAEGPLDLSAMFVMHHGFRRDLRDLAAAVPFTPLGDAQVWQALAERWTNLTDALHHHHRVEDSWIWPPLLDRVDANRDPQGRQTLEAMEAEHAMIDPMLESCAAGFAAMTSAPSTADPGPARGRGGPHANSADRSSCP